MRIDFNRAHNNNRIPIESHMVLISIILTVAHVRTEEHLYSRHSKMLFLWPQLRG